MANIHNIPSLDSIEIDNFGRFYYSPTKNFWYPSITTVTGHKKAEFFKEWRKNPENKEIIQKSSSRGTKLHNIIENYMDSQKEDLSKLNSEDHNLFHQIKPELLKINNIQIQETGLWSDLIKVAGRVDCIGYYEDELSVIDYKTSLKLKKKEWIQNYFEQATGYSIMYEERTGIPVKNIVIIITCSDGNLQVFKERSIDHVHSLSETIKSYWNKYNFDLIQRKIKDKIENGL